MHRPTRLRLHDIPVKTGIQIFFHLLDSRFLGGDNSLIHFKLIGLCYAREIHSHCRYYSTRYPIDKSKGWW